jgi:hypothetical protein
VNLPSIPQHDGVPFPAGRVVTADEMNALSYACTFAMNPPDTRVHATTTQSLSSGGTFVNYDTIDYDADGMFSISTPGRLTVQTAGFYKVRYMVNVGAFGCNAFVQTTTGPNNPAGSSRVSQAQWGAYVLGGGPANGAMGASGILKQYMFAGDYCQVTAMRPAGAVTTILTDVGSWLSLEFVSI